MAREANKSVRVLVLTGLGLNCEEETAQAFRMCGAQADLVHLSDVLEPGTPIRLGHYQILAMIGGFSFGDHLGAAVVYANRLRSRWWRELLEFVDAGGLVVGICNGFQAMARLGLVPSLDGIRGEQQVTLTANERLGYRDGWVRLKAEAASPCIWTRSIDVIELPARHGEGRFVASGETLERIEQQGLVAMRYVDQRGRPTQGWPDNPNGSLHAIAGICDPTGRLFGLMPHPDAYLYGFHHPRWAYQKLAGTLKERGQGLSIFQNGVDYAAAQLRRGR